MRPGLGKSQRRVVGGVVGRDAGVPDPMVEDPPILLAAVVGLLKSGMSPQAAWASVGVMEVAADGTPVLPWTGRSARAVGAACRLSHHTGAPLATVLAAVSEHVAASLEADARREAAAAGPQLSARVLMFLPGVGLGLGAVVDARVLRVVATTALGWGLLVIAAALMWAGWAWMRRMLRVAQAASLEQ